MGITHNSVNFKIFTRFVVNSAGVQVEPYRPVQKYERNYENPRS